MRLNYFIFTIFFCVFLLFSFTENNKNIKLTSAYSPKLAELTKRILIVCETMDTLGSISINSILENHIERFDGFIVVANSESAKTSTILALIANEFDLLAESYDSIAKMSDSIQKKTTLLLNEADSISKDAGFLINEANSELKSLNDSIAKIETNITSEQDEIKKLQLENKKQHFENQIISLNEIIIGLKLFVEKLKKCDTELTNFYDNLISLLFTIRENSFVYNRIADNIRINPEIERTTFIEPVSFSPMTNEIINSWKILDELTLELRKKYQLLGNGLN